MDGEQTLAFVRRLIAAGCDPDVAVSVTSDVVRHVMRHALKSKAAIRAKRYRDRKRDARNVTQRDVSASNKRTSKGEVVVDPVDSGSSGERGTGRNKATRIAADLTLAADWEGFAFSVGLSRPEVDAQFAKFRDYWTAKSGREAAKLDWFATWRNWCRTFLERAGRPPTPPTKPGEFDADAWARSRGLPTTEELRARRGNASVVENRDGVHQEQSQPPDRNKSRDGRIQSVGSVFCGTELGARILPLRQDFQQQDQPALPQPRMVSAGGGCT